MVVDIVFMSSTRILFFLILLEKGFALIEENQTLSKNNQQMLKEYSTSSPTTVKHLHKQLERKSSEISLEKSPFVYRRQQYNESMEKVQVTDKGMLLKSSYVPILSNQPDSNSFDVRGETCGGVHSTFEGNQSIMQRSSSPAATRSAKENFVTKDGKKYRIVKVKKTIKSISEEQLKNQIQRRTFKPLSSLMSILPLKWMTPRRENEISGTENTSQWSEPNSFRHPEENSKNAPEQKRHTGDKIKKLLNLFTIVQFGNEYCYADGVEGTCLHQVECEAKAGKFTSACAEDLGVCCYTEKTCGDTSNDNTTYFINEGFPETSSAAPKVCTLTLEKGDPKVKQLRLDFIIFQLREPTNGTCLHDRLIVSGQDTNAVVPDICGANTGQHVYVDVEDSSGPFVLNIVTMGEYFPRNFRIKVTQVKEGDELLAPKNCLQYYAEPTGYVQTFNYQENINENLDHVVSGYFNNLNYAICIKKNKEFCSISYENEEIESIHPTFQLVNVDEDGEKLLPPRQAGAETFDCPDDYIIINGIRLCGEKLNDASYEVDFTRNFPVTDTTNGPYVVYVRTDATVSGRGFNLKYRQHPCPT